MAVGFLLGFLLGLLALAVAQGAALILAIRSLRRRGAAPPESATELSADRAFPCDKQGFLWMLEPEKMPKLSSSHPSTTGVHQETKDRRNIVEVFPVRMLAKIKGHSLILSGPDHGSQMAIELLNCTVVAVSASNLPSRKWSKRYPIKLESKVSEICKGSKVCYLYVDTSWEKESWCKALRLASATDKQKLNLHARLTEEFHSYISSLNSGYHCFLKPSALSAEDHEVMDRAVVRSDGSSKVRNFLRKLARKAHTKASQESKTSSMPSARAEDRSSSSSSPQHIKQPSTPGSDSGRNSRLSDSHDTDTDERFADGGTLCWNLLFSRLFFDAKMSGEVNNAIKARIQRTLSNMRTPAYIGEITLTDLSLGKLPPYVRRMRVLPLDLNELWAFEVDFEYRSGILLHIETRLEVQEPELQKDIMKTTLKGDSIGDVDSEFLESIEHYGNRFRPSQALASAAEDKDEAGVLRQSKSTGWTSTYISRWKNILHSISDHVSQVPFSLAIGISSVRGTMRVHIKPPPSDQIWYGFTSMPELEWELESSVGDRKITNSPIASLIRSRIKASLHQSLVLPNCESIPVPWMIADKDDWVPRKAAPFVWLNREPGEAGTAAFQPEDDVPASKVTGASNIKASTSSPPAPSARSDREPAAAEASAYHSSPASSGGLMPLLSSTRLQFEEEASENGSRELEVAVVPAGEQPSSTPPPPPPPPPGEDAKRGGGRRARVMEFGRKMGGKLEEKGRHVVEKMKENAAAAAAAARTNRQ